MLRLCRVRQSLLLNDRALRDPLVGCIHQLGEIVVGDAPGRDVKARGDHFRTGHGSSERWLRADRERGRFLRGRGKARARAPSAGARPSTTRTLPEGGTTIDTLRALALVGEIIYGAKPSYEDPARYSFAHGGKDGHPYPVYRELYDANLERLREAIAAARLGRTDKIQALKSLGAFTARLA